MYVFLLIKIPTSVYRAFSLDVAGFAEQYGTMVATPGIAEKGFLNVLVEVTAPGGHSSIPPAHTVILHTHDTYLFLNPFIFQSIGILSALLVHYEQNPYKVKIVRYTVV